jgi:hypothetical protein
MWFNILVITFIPQVYVLVFFIYYRDKAQMYKRSMVGLCNIPYPYGLLSFINFLGQNCQG